MSPQASVADRRFQHYTGVRLGAVYAFWALAIYSMGWVVGLKRSTRYKLVPFLVIGLPYLPSFAAVIFASVIQTGLPTYLDMYGFMLPAIYIFVALSAPELICPDRRHGTLRMYMTANINPQSYVGAKLTAVWSVLSIVTVGPVVVVLIGYSLLGHGPHSWGDAARTVAQVLGGGLALALFYGTLALAVSSLTDRNSFASAGIILAFILTGAALGILEGPLSAPAWVALFNINQVPTEMINRIYGAHGAIDVPTWELTLAFAAWVLAGIGVLGARYLSEGRR